MLTAALDKPPLIVLVGPTAVGKTKYSIALAERFDCEIISGDSMQVYKGMDIGTAKITPEETRGIPHHMIDIHEPDYPFSAAEFQERARHLILDIHSRGKLPMIVGGTGLYIEALCYGYSFTEGGVDEEYRNQLRQLLADEGEQALHDRLKAVDPETAARLHPRDTRRVIRALEIYHLSGKPMSQQLQDRNRESPYRLCLIGLTMDRQKLYERIDQRVDLMMEQGLVAEVERLLAQGYGPDLVSMQGLGYKEIAAYLTGQITLDEAVYLLKRNTRRFAKRQWSWFRHMKEIQWVDITDTENFSEHLQTISAIITGKFDMNEEYNGEQPFRP